MESQKTSELLEKYWQGETSREEEAQLRRYFRENDPPAHLHHVAALFRHYEARPQLDEAFDERLATHLTDNRAVPMWPALLKIAVVVAIFLLGAVWIKQTYVTPPEPTVAVAAPDTYQDPERAYEETKQALLLVSSLMNEGTQHLTKLEEFDEAQQTVKEEPSEL